MAEALNDAYSTAFIRMMNAVAETRLLLYFREDIFCKIIRIVAEIKSLAFLLKLQQKTLLICLFKYSL